MDALVRNCFIAVNLFTMVDLFQRRQMTNSTAVNTTTTGVGKENNGEATTSLRVTIALIVGIGLSAVIIGCLGFFLCRGYMEQKHYHNHKQLVRLNQNGTHGRYLKNDESQDFAEHKL